LSREWRDAAKGVATAWGRDLGVELRWRSGKVRIFRARRCAGVCGRWLADLDRVPNIDAVLCTRRECRSAYERARRANLRIPTGEFAGPTVAAPATRAERRALKDEPICIGVVEWLRGYAAHVYPADALRGYGAPRPRPEQLAYMAFTDARERFENEQLRQAGVTQADLIEGELREAELVEAETAEVIDEDLIA